MYGSMQKDATCFVHTILTAVYKVIINAYARLAYIPGYLYTFLLKLIYTYSFLTCVHSTSHLSCLCTSSYVALWFCTFSAVTLQ